MSSELEKFIKIRVKILESDTSVLPTDPDWKHHVSFLALAQAIQADLAELRKELQSGTDNSPTNDNGN